MKISFHSLIYNLQTSKLNDLYDNQFQESEFKLVQDNRAGSSHKKSTNADTLI